MFTTEFQPMSSGRPGSGAESMALTFSSKTVIPPCTTGCSLSAFSGPTGTQTCRSVPCPRIWIGPMGSDGSCSLRWPSLPALMGFSEVGSSTARRPTFMSVATTKGPVVTSFSVLAAT